MALLLVDDVVDALCITKIACVPSHEATLQWVRGPSRRAGAIAIDESDPSP